MQLSQSALVYFRVPIWFISLPAYSPPARLARCVSSLCRQMQTDVCVNGARGRWETQGQGRKRHVGVARRPRLVISNFQYVPLVTGDPSDVFCITSSLDFPSVVQRIYSVLWEPVWLSRHAPLVKKHAERSFHMRSCEPTVIMLARQKWASCWSGAQRMGNRYPFGHFLGERSRFSDGQITYGEIRVSTIS
jgi:hypothetical protein